MVAVQPTVLLSNCSSVGAVMEISVGRKGYAHPTNLPQNVSSSASFHSLRLITVSHAQSSSGIIWNVSCLMRRSVRSNRHNGSLLVSTRFYEYCTRL